MGNNSWRQIHDQLIHCRDGEVVLYRRRFSQRWQARFKLADGLWRRVTTRHKNVDYAARRACEAYDRARFLADEHLPIVTRRFDSVARAALEEMRAQLKAGQGKSVYHTYISSIERYLILNWIKIN